MIMVPLGELVNIVGGGTPDRKTPQYWNGSIPWATVKDLRSTVLETTEEKITGEGIANSASRLIPAGSVIVATRMGLGKVAINTGDVAINQDLKAIFCSSLLDSHYLLHFLASNAEKFEALGKGATVKGITLDVLREVKIPFPPLSEQCHIAAILDKANAIRRKRQEAIRLSEELLRSAFMEMFGDPVTNPKGWPERILVEVSDIRSGVTKGKKLDGKLTVSVPYMRVANVQDGHINLDEIKEIAVTPADAERYTLHPGDVLLTEGGDPDKLGRGAVWRGAIESCIHQNHIFRVRPNTKVILPEFLSILIGSARGKKYFLRAAKQTTGIASINKTQLSNFPVLLPPLQLQRQFVALVKRQETLQQNLAAELKLHDTLFNSLIQRAFRGELTAHDESSESVTPFAEPIHAERTDARKVVPLKRVKKEREESTAAEAKRHAGHDMYNKAALAAYIVSRCHDSAEPMGRVKLAKLFYLVQRKVDLTLTETFTRRAAGPLDDAIHKFLPFAQKNNWIDILPQVGMKKPVGPGNSCEIAVKKAVKFLGEKRSAVDEVLDSLRGMKGHDLECWATVDAVAEELAASGKPLTVRNIVQALAASPEWRPKLEKPAFSELNIAAAILGLRKLGFLKTRHYP